MELYSSSKNHRKYNSTYRKKLTSKIEKIKDKSSIIEIYNMITNDIGSNFSSNRNGIFINFNLLSDDCIENINNYLEDKLNITNTQTETETKTKINYKSYNMDEVEMISEMGHKLSNQEKTIIKRIRSKN